jgi:hypothetical protein
MTEINLNKYFQLCPMWLTDIEIENSKIRQRSLSEERGKRSGEIEYIWLLICPTFMNREQFEIFAIYYKMIEDCTQYNIQKLNE